MTQTQSTAVAVRPSRRFHFEWVVPTLLRPRQAFGAVVAEAGATWVAPLAILTALAILQVLVAAPLTQAAAANEPTALPPDYQYYTPEQQAQFEQAMAATSGPVFVYVFPVALALARVLLGWVIISVALHLVLTLFGSRGTTGSVMSVVAWAGLPFAVRDLVRIAFMLTADQLIRHPGLSGFVAGDAGGGAFFLAGALKSVDLYWIWHTALLALGVHMRDDVSPLKVWASVLLVQLSALALRGLSGVLMGQLSGLNIIRPFFF